jgi:hypothetical protein
MQKPSARPGRAAAEGADAASAMYKSTELADTAKRLAWIGKDPEAFRNRTTLHPAGRAPAGHRDGAGRPPQGSRRQPGTRDPAIHGGRDRLEEVAGQAGLPGRQLDAARDLRHRGAVHAARRHGQGPVLDRRRHRREATNKEPFNAPAKLLQAIREKRYGVFKDPVLGTVPVNFLSSADTTGGNSGSAVMNKRGELVGLNFDSTYESITKDWYFDR